MPAPIGAPGASVPTPSWLLTAKCLTLAMTPCSCTPLVQPAAIFAARNGSSPKYSNVRPLSGVRIMFTAGANTTSLPLRRTSSPTTAAWRAAAAGSNVEATVIGDGMPVALPCRVPTGPSLK
jgi:hypothetical protein